MRRRWPCPGAAAIGRRNPWGRPASCSGGRWRGRFHWGFAGYWSFFRAKCDFPSRFQCTSLNKRFSLTVIKMELTFEHLVLFGLSSQMAELRGFLDFYPRFDLFQLFQVDLMLFFLPFCGKEFAGLWLRSVHLVFCLLMKK